MRTAYRLFTVGILGLLVLLCTVDVGQAEQQDLRVISSDAFGLILELQLPACTLDEVKGQIEAFQRVNLPGWAATTEPGRPALPVKSALIQAPRTGEIFLDIFEEEQEVLGGCRISRLKPVNGTGMGETSAFGGGEAVPGAPDFFPPDRIWTSGRQFLRGDCLVRLNLCPFQFNTSSGDLRITKRMRISVRFENALPKAQPDALTQALPQPACAPVGEPVFSQILRRTVLNYERREDAPPQANSTDEDTPVPSRSTAADISGKSLRVEIKKLGLYRITYNDLLTRNLNPSSINPASLRMLNRGNEIAIKVVSALPDRLGPGDRIEFFARGMDDSYTGSNVYWLTWGEGNGKRIKSTDGRLSGQAARLGYFTDTLHFEKNLAIWSFTPGAPDADHWFWEKLTAPMTGNFTINLPSVVPGQSHAVLRVALRGGTTMAPHPNHHTTILLNGVQLGGASWDGDKEYIHTVTIPVNLLKEGGNTVGISMPGDTGAPVDVVFLNWIKVKYKRFLKAENNRLLLHVKGEGRREIVVRNLSRSDIRIFDISSSASPREVTGLTVRGTWFWNRYSAAFQDTVYGKKSYLVTAGNGVRSPERLSTWKPVDLAGSHNRADYILITSRSFLGSVAPLLQWHKNAGLRVKAVAVEDIYNEFNHGIFHPSAIKEFLQAACNNWQKPAPTYVLLVGDANGDYRDYQGTGKKNIVPPHLSITEGLGLTPDDGWYVSFGADAILPSLLIGRLSANTPEAAAQVAEKVIAYEETVGYQPRAALFVADNDEFSFEFINEELITSLPDGLSPRRVYLSRAASPASARASIINRINSGMLITNYVGHGNAFYWSAEKIFQDSDVALLNNPGKLTFVTSFDCYNGFFAHPSKYSLGELFVITPGKGAIGSFAPSGTGYPWEHDILAKALFSSVFHEGDSIMGSFTTKAKIDAYASGVTPDLLKCYSLIGDPASRLRVEE